MGSSQRTTGSPVEGSFPVKQCWEAESTTWIQGSLLLTWQYCWWCGFGVEIFQFSSCTVDCVTGWQCCIVKTSISSTRNRPGSWDYANKLVFHHFKLAFHTSSQKLNRGKVCVGFRGVNPYLLGSGAWKHDVRPKHHSENYGKGFIVDKK